MNTGGKFWREDCELVLDSLLPIHFFIQKLFSEGHCHSSVLYHPLLPRGVTGPVSFLWAPGTEALRVALGLLGCQGQAGRTEAPVLR